MADKLTLGKWITLPAPLPLPCIDCQQYTHNAWIAPEIGNDGKRTGRWVVTPLCNGCRPADRPSAEVTA